MPPLNALRAFEAAARHLSFRKAAEELHVTPAAISHQVKVLEGYLGVRLFRRLSRGLELTAAAAASLGGLRDGFASLAAAVEQMRAHTKVRTLTIGVPPSFAAKWLVPRLHRFISAYPDLDVRVAASDEFIDPRQDAVGRNADRAGQPRSEVDVSIRFGRGAYPGHRVDRLFSVSATPICSPRLLQGEHALLRFEDLRHHTLLHDDTIGFEDGGADWKSWLRAAGVEGIDATRGPHFNHAALALDAAADGGGVVLSYPLLASDDIEAGVLVAPFDLSIPLNIAYYLVRAEAVADEPSVAAFRNWLVNETKSVRTEEPGERRGAASPLMAE